MREVACARKPSALEPAKTAGPGETPGPGGLAAATPVAGFVSGHTSGSVWSPTRTRSRSYKRWHPEEGNEAPASRSERRIAPGEPPLEPLLLRGR